MDPDRAPDVAEAILESRILVLDDEPDNLKVLRRLLEAAGYGHVETSSTPTAIRELLAEFRPDLLLLDLRMPELDGFGVMDVVAGMMAPGEYFPVLVLTAFDDPEVRRRALAAGARDFVGKPFESTEILLRIRNLLETRRLHRELRDHADRLGEEVRERTAALARSREEILHRLALAAEFRDDATGRHAERVGILSDLLARGLGMSESEIELIRLAAPLHDVGKIGIPDAILLKPGPLSATEFDVMKAHTGIGARILGGSDNPLLGMARRIALSHHERWDGSGYQGLAGEAIPVEGRIVAVADVFDSLGHARPYKTAAARPLVMREIVDGRGGLFDPRVVDALLALEAEGALDSLEDQVSADLNGRPRDAGRGPPAARRSAHPAGETRW